MSSEHEQTPETLGDTDEKQLCVNCMFPNECSTHFCAKCGAPMTSYAATGPFEHIFAEGHTYRQAAERPRSLIVVLGVWLIFGMMALAGAALILFGWEMGLQYWIAGAFFVPVSVVMIWKTTRSYLGRSQVKEGHDE